MLESGKLSREQSRGYNGDPALAAEIRIACTLTDTWHMTLEAFVW